MLAVTPHYQGSHLILIIIVLFWHMQFRTERLIEYKKWQGEFVEYKKWQGECAPGLVTEIIAVCWNPNL